MFAAVLNAFADSVNALLIGVLVAIGIMLPQGQYRRVATRLIAGDWLGVLSAALVVTFLFVGIREHVMAALESPVAGWTLVAVGVGLAVLAWRSKGQPNAMVDKLLGPLRQASARTVVLGYVLGVVQSLTSVPFYMGLMYLVAGDFTPLVTYGGLFFYATFALSLPTVCAVFIGVVRAMPDSWAGRAFSWARTNSATVSLVGGYVVAVFLIIMGAVIVARAA
ncbi:hypothetical protein G7Y31_03790 [Corynebacterium lizhenjunii]|uniref:Sap, sulfolipid-1-addressing protein n=1 Tax=Corynebacterium lizhenjunii TaxID=2709394 RepID=A0A7T0PAF5_9CORY|nr:hypothetical protein [Corynebacterium lizhenjunii]QPK79828.1 hypothetical protein G7Y31_03790 [Corynebacterium lizhenjunii]